MPKGSLEHMPAASSLSCSTFLYPTRALGNWQSPCAPPSSGQLLAGQTHLQAPQARFSKFANPSTNTNSRIRIHALPKAHGSGTEPEQGPSQHVWGISALKWLRLKWQCGVVTRSWQLLSKKSFEDVIAIEAGEHGQQIGTSSGG
jgi:hypothetical protein